MNLDKEQLVLVSNFDQMDVTVEPGELVAAVVDGGICAAREPPEIAHVRQDYEELANISEIEVPPAEYYCEIPSPAVVEVPRVRCIWCGRASRIWFRCMSCGLFPLCEPCLVGPRAHVCPEDQLSAGKVCADAEPSKVTDFGLFLPEHASERRRSLDLAGALRQMQSAAPGVPLHLEVHTPSLDDGAGSSYYFAPLKWPGDVSGRAAKALRRDGLTAVAAVVRWCATRWPAVVLGVGQGGLVALLCSYPRVVEAALALRYVRPDEGCQVAEAWFNVRAFASLSPRYANPSRPSLFFAAFPEVLAEKRGAEAAAPASLVFPTSGPHLDFHRALADQLAIPSAAVLGDVLFQGTVQAGPRFSEFRGGRCACGRASLLLSRCSVCIRADEANAAEPEDEEPPEELRAMPRISAVGLRSPWQSVLWVSAAEVLEAAAALASGAEFRTSSGVEFRTVFMPWPSPAGSAGRADAEVKTVYFAEAPTGSPLRMTFGVLDGCVALLQPCVETSLETSRIAVLPEALHCCTAIVHAFAPCWMLFSSPGGGSCPLGATHQHRACRGVELVAGDSVRLSSWAGQALGPFVEALAADWDRALQSLSADADFAANTSTFAGEPREAFAVPDVAAVGGGGPSHRGVVHGPRSACQSRCCAAWSAPTGSRSRWPSARVAGRPRRATEEEGRYPALRFAWGCPRRR